MMHKERLEKIKKELELVWSDISYVVDQDDVKWLINRVEKLQLEVNDWRDEAIKWNKRFEESEESHLEVLELLESILKQNKCYREALKEIARGIPGASYKARKALEEEI